CRNSRTGGPAIRRLARPEAGGERPVDEALSLRAHLDERRPPEQPRALGKSERAHRLLLVRGDDEPLATLGSAALEHVAPRLGGVALAEPVLPVAADLARLVRALHDDCLPWQKARQETTRRPGCQGTRAAKHDASRRALASSGLRPATDVGTPTRKRFELQRSPGLRAAIPRRSGHFSDPT